MSETTSLVLIGIVGGLVVPVSLILLNVVYILKCQQEIRDLLKARKD